MDILKNAQENFDYMVKVRRLLHENPEPSNFEIETMKYVENELTQMGIPFIHIENGGILGFINQEKEGKTLLLRADMDALPMAESENNLAGKKIVVSKVPNVAHTCGHDAHTAMLLGQAKILNEHKDEIPGKIVLCFEQGEEGTMNVQHLMRYLEGDNGVDVDACFGTHVRWNLETGKVSAVPGAALSGIIAFKGKVKGRGGHGSRPDISNNPLDCFASIYQSLNEIRMKKIDPYKNLTFSMCHVEMGSAFNVIPEELFFEGSIRYFDLESGNIFWEAFKRMAKERADSYDCEFEMSLILRMLPTISEETCANICADAVKKYLGEEAFCEIDPWMASETMSLYLSTYPGVFTFTGIMNEEKGTGANHHTPEFDVDEDAMVTGVAAAVGFVVEYFKKNPTIEFKKTFDDVDKLIAFFKD